MHKKTQQVLEKFIHDKKASYVKKDTVIYFKQQDSESIYIEIVRPHKTEPNYKIPKATLDTAVKNCILTGELLNTSELRQLVLDTGKKLGSRESPVWAILNLMPESFWKE